MSQQVIQWGKWHCWPGKNGLWDHPHCPVLGSWMALLDSKSPQRWSQLGAGLSLPQLPEPAIPLSSKLAYWAQSLLMSRSYSHTASFAFAGPTNMQGVQVTGSEILCNLLSVASTDLCLTPRRAPGTHGQHIHGSSSLHRIPAGPKHIPVRANMRPGVQTAPCHSDTKSCGCLLPFRATGPRHSDLGIIFPATSKEEGGPSVRCSPPSVALRCP